MNKTAIKNFAIWARVNLIESAKQRAYEYEITDGGQNNPNAEIIGGRPLSRNEQNQRKQLIEQIRVKGFNQVMEEAAYTWFNRFIALRYMEVNGYLPTRIRVFTNEEGEFKPEILKEAMIVELDGLDREIVLDLLDKQDNEALYKMLLIAQCNALSTGLPYMFEKIANWTELLFPENLLKTDSVIGQMISSISEEDWTDAVQIIGWLYQFYNSEPKDKIANRANTIKVNKNEIPAVTQLFTPDWIVRYMVENSLGRIYIQRKLVNSGDWLIADEATKVAMEKKEAASMGWRYYLPEAEQEPAVREQLIVISNSYTSMKVEDIKVIDPCMGSGHILVYAFDVLMQIYTASGWSERDAAKSILENNIFGLDIDDRAGQLAYFAIMMKARKYNRRILTSSVQTNVLSIQESAFMTADFIKYVANGDARLTTELEKLKKEFEDAKDYGSAIILGNHDFKLLYTRIKEIVDSTPNDLFAMLYREIVEEKLGTLVKQAEYLSKEYDVVITNPPYMGRRSMEPKFCKFLDTQYPNAKMDLFSAFIQRNIILTKKDGFASFMTPFVWLFLSSYAALREELLGSVSISSFVQPEEASFQEAAVSICAFVIQKTNVDYKGTFVRMSNFHNPDEQAFRLEQAASGTDKSYTYSVSRTQFRNYPDNRIIYWASPALTRAFLDGKQLGTICQPRQGMATTNNDLFLRLWFEVEYDKIGFGCRDEDDAFESEKKWFPYNKGGGLKRWYGNFDYLVNYENKGKTICDYIDNTPGARVGSNGRVINRQFFFHKSITWSDICGTSFAARACPQGFIFDVKGSSAFVNDKLYPIIVAFLNSSACTQLLNTLNPTITTQVGDLKQLPFLYPESHYADIVRLVEDAIQITRDDYDSFETSWDFKKHPLLRGEGSIREWYRQWESECENRFSRLKTIEESINMHFLSAYGLQDEMDAQIDDGNITIGKAEEEREIRSLISYAVGCMFGRYSIESLGLQNGEAGVNGGKNNTFEVDVDAIIPICDDEYFQDDIVVRFVDFLKIAFGEAYLDENLTYVASVLGGKGTPQDIIRNYFLNDFYVDHCANYSVSGSGRRPIYWLFDSGKKNGFKCLIYMHRYQPDTIARIRTDYIHELQSRYRTAITDLEDRVEHAAASERVKLGKQLAKIKDQELELRKYEEKIHHLADQMIEIDLDDGVKVNYAKFGDVLAKIK